MAALSSSDRNRIAKAFQRYISRKNEKNFESFLKSDVLSTIAAVDNWVDTNESSFNDSLPTVAKTNLTTKQKSFVLMVVISMRIGFSFLKIIIREAD